MGVDLAVEELDLVGVVAAVVVVAVVVVKRD